MQHTRCGPLAGWWRLLGVIRVNWTGVLAFLAVAWIIGIALWMVLFGVGFAVMIVGVLLVVFIGSALTELSSAFEPVVAAVFFAGVAGYYYTIALIEAPVRSYVRYYALAILGDSDPELDLIADQRAAIAETASTDSALETADESTTESATELTDEPTEPVATDSESDSQPVDAEDPTEPEFDSDDESTER